MKHRQLVVPLAALVLLTACGGEGPASSTSVVDTSEAVAATASPTEISTLSASELFDWITWIEEWKPGEFLVSGFDGENIAICGIMDSSGKVRLLEGYASAYALADGKMIVSEQPVNTWVDANKEAHSIQGAIVDEDGNVLYDTGEEQRLFIVNPETIFAVRASTGFEGDVVEYSVLDQNAEWIYEWTQSDIIPVEMEEERISFDSIYTHIQHSQAPDGATLFSIGAQYANDYDNQIYYWTVDKEILWNDISEVLPPELQNTYYPMQPRLYNNQLLLEHNVVYQGNRTYHSIYDDLIIGDPDEMIITPEIQNSIDNDQFGSMMEISYLGSVAYAESQMPIFKAEHVFYFPDNSTGSLSNLQTKTIYLLGEDGGKIQFGDEYADFILSLWVSGNKLIAQMVNREGDYYVAPFAPDGTILAEPYPLGALSISGVEDDCLLLYDNDTYTVAIWDANSGEELTNFTYDARYGECDSVTKLSDGLFLVRFLVPNETINGYAYAVYQMDGTRIA